MQEWTKVNDEVWLLRRRHVRGSHVFVLNGTDPLFHTELLGTAVDYDTWTQTTRNSAWSIAFSPSAPYLVNRFKERCRLTGGYAISIHALEQR